MSDTSQGPGWWLASDGKWYPPELWTGPPQTGPTGFGSPEPAPANQPVEPGHAAQPSPSDATQAQPGGGIPPYPSAGTVYGGTPEAYLGQAGQPPYPYSSSGYGGPSPSVKNNGLAVASLICSCVGLLFALLGILGIIFGFIARSQIRRSQGAQKGDGLALAGIIIGFVSIALVITIFAVRGAHHHDNGGVVGFLASTMTPLGS